MTRWTSNDIPDQSGRVAIVTGANTGIGFETARALVEKGASVTLACRNRKKGEQALERLRQVDPKASTMLDELDLSDLDDVKAFSARFIESHQRLDLLILNAGVMIPPESKTAQGFELQFGVNHLGHFALAGGLLPLMQATRDSRVVVVSSVAALNGAIDFDDLSFEKRGYAPSAAYSQSKLANQLFARELQRRLRSAGSHVVVTAAHPGYTATDLQRSSAFWKFMNPILAMEPPQGALPTLRAATDPEAAGGEYFGPDGLLQIRGYPKQIKMAKKALDDDVAERLWDVSEELTGVHYQFAPRGQSSRV
jgi:NAD(P)-dependent dehydrogenase (short-subunit alcohol dehydrogenase family)